MRASCFLSCLSLFFLVSAYNLFLQFNHGSKNTKFTPGQIGEDTALVWLLIHFFSGPMILNSLSFSLAFNSLEDTPATRDYLLIYTISCQLFQSTDLHERDLPLLSG